MPMASRPLRHNVRADSTRSALLDNQSFTHRSLNPLADPIRPRRRSLQQRASSLNLSVDPGNSLGAATAINAAGYSATDQVSSGDRDDFYRFTTNQSGVFTATLSGLSGDADVKLIQDRNGNSAIDIGETLAWQWERGAGNEAIRRFVGSGTYFVQVTSYRDQAANYSLTTNFTAANQDNRQFSIRTTLGEGLQQLSTAARDAINQAARFWERAIVSSSRAAGSQTLNIDISGVSRNDSVLAFAGPNRFFQTGNSRLLPTAGTATINMRFSNDYNQSPTYLRDIMIHEFGHVLGIGTLWENGGQSLIDRATTTYRANTHAGWAYGELTGSFTPTAIPVEPGIFGHWDENRFTAELMTPRAEAPGIATPLSQITIASLRDLGWNVNYGAAQSYALSSQRLAQATASTRSATDTASRLPTLCGCAYHLASLGFNTIGSSHLRSATRLG
ncbi:MAG: hypothetical protein Kow00121_51140 [Elainellaceae cyanobacterium]